MTKLCLLFILFFFFTVVCLAQEGKKQDEKTQNGKPKLTRKQFVIDSTNIMRPRLARPQFRIDNRTIFFGPQRINITGIDAGALFKEKLRLTLGYYTLNNTTLKSVNKTIDGKKYEGNYRLNYGALNMEIIYKNTRYFSLGMPLEFGLGQNRINYISTTDSSETGISRGSILIAYFGLSGTFKPIRWFGLKISVGYRKTVFNQLRDIKFDGLYTSFGLAVDFREIIKDVRMYNLQRKYKKNFNSIGTAVDLITD
jgi:hypothetical protein